MRTLLNLFPFGFREKCREPRCCGDGVENG
jgi:hypothetical protein